MSNIELSSRVQRIKPSPTLAVTTKAAELRAQGKDIISLSVGEPDFDTPEHIREAAKRAIDQGQTRYTAVGGTPELKDAIIAKFKRDNGFEYTRNEILVSNGGKQSFFNMALALLNDGDEAIIPAPYWVSYPDMVLVAGGVPVVIETTAQDRFKITAAQLEAAITPKTRLFVINGPSNPSGVAYTKDELAALGAVLAKHPQIVIATDDMYEHILWTGEPFVNIVNVCPELKERTLVLNGVSKAYAMTGWRIGFAAGPEVIIKAMQKIQGQSTSGASSVSQAAATEALNADQNCVADMVKVFKQRHDWLVTELDKIPGVNTIRADGTFYAFVDMNEAIKAKGLKDDLELADGLLESGVAIVPGSAFGAPGCVRLSFATSNANLEKAVERIAAFLTK